MGCVLALDHHCVFLHNCVGEQNHRQFLVFLLWTFIGVEYFLMGVAAVALQGGLCHPFGLCEIVDMYGSHLPPSLMPATFWLVLVASGLSFTVSLLVFLLMCR